MDRINKENTSGPLCSDLYEELRTDILSGRMRDGSKLSEKAVCERYGMSRTPVREALFRLEAEGLVQMIPNRGAFVMGLSGRDISDIFDLRALFEVQAVEWAIKRMSVEEVEKLSEALDFMEFYTLKGDMERLREFDKEFHRIIYEGAKDRMILRSLETYMAYLDSTLEPLPYKTKQLKEIFEEHKAIFIAFDSQNVKAGRLAMERHMDNIRQRRFPGGVRKQ